MVSFTKEQLESFCYVLHEVAMGNSGYRLRLSDRNEYYNLLAKYVNLVGEVCTRYLVENDKKINVPDFMEIHLGKDLQILEVSQNVPELLDKDPQGFTGLSFRYLLTEETLKGWEKLESYFSMPSPVQFGTRMNYQVNNWVYYTCFCFINGRPDGSFRVSSYINEERRDTKTVMRDLGLSHHKGSIGHFRFTPASIEITEKKKNKQLQVLISYMEEHLDEPIPDMKILAHKIGFNEKKLVSSFKETFHKTPYTYFCEMKMLKALNLLQTTNLSIEEVAVMVGYPTRSSFYKAFKRKFGIPPGAVERDI